MTAAVANLPGTCMVVPASSINLIGTMRAVNLTNLGLGLGGKHSAERRRVHAARWHDGRSRRMPPGAHRQGCLLHRVHAGCRRADCGELSHGRQGRGPRGEHRQPASARAGRLARRGRVDRLGDQSPGAQFRRLPQCGPGDGAGGGQRERAVERHLQREPDQLCRRCVAGRRAASECAFDQPERGGRGAHGEGDL